MRPRPRECRREFAGETTQEHRRHTNQSRAETLGYHARTDESTARLFAETISASGAFVFRVDYQASGQ